MTYSPQNIELSELIQKLEEIKSKGFILTKRAHKGGAGNTLEELLGVEANNLSLPDLGIYELKVKRKNKKTPLTLFSKTPDPRGAATRLFDEYSEISDKDGIRKLYARIPPNKKGSRYGLYLKIRKNEIYIKNKKNIKAYWDIEQLFATLKNKMSQTVLVIADTKGRVGAADEEFYFEEAWLLSKISRESFIQALKKSILVVEIRIGADKTGEMAGKYHNHGTAFRVKDGEEAQLFSEKKRLL